MKLYSYWRSTTSCRVRIALNLKGLEYDVVPVDLIAGAQRSHDYSALNPIKGVPTLVTDSGTALTQSMAILDYLDEVAPTPPLLPKDNPELRAHIYAAALIFATDVHPVNNLKVVDMVRDLTDANTSLDWMHHWMIEGLKAFDVLIEPNSEFSFGDTPTLADICLVAQAYNAHRWGVDLTPFPRLTEIENRCLVLPAFDAARPENQKDAT